MVEVSTTCRKRIADPSLDTTHRACPGMNEARETAQPSDRTSMTKSRVHKLEHRQERWSPNVQIRAGAMNRGLTGASAVEANNVDESMSFFKASETFG